MRDLLSAPRAERPPPAPGRTRCNRLTRTRARRPPRVKRLAAKRELLDARPDGVLAVTASNSAAMFVSADPATHDDLRAAVNADDRGDHQSARDSRAALADHARRARQRGRAARPAPRGRRAAHAGPRRPRARPRGWDSARGPELRRAPASRAADRGGGRGARGRRDEPVDGRVRRVAGGHVRGGRARHAARGAARAPGRVGRDDDGRDGIEPARVAARARPGGAERQARRAAAEPLADRGVGDRRTTASAARRRCSGSGPKR